VLKRRISGNLFISLVGQGLGFLIKKNSENIYNGYFIKYNLPLPDYGAYMSFRRSYLKANKVSKSEETREVEYAHHFYRASAY